MSGRADDLEQRDRVIRFLKNVASQAEGLWIGGDLFDFWYEWRHAIPKIHFEVVAALKKLVDQGVAVHLIPGNHDFAISNFFTDQIGATIHHSPSEIELDGQRIYWHHGDGVAPSDGGYRLLKRVLHNRTAQAMFRWIHPDVAMGIALMTSKSSRYKSDTIGVPPDEEYEAFAKEILALGKNDVVLMGHTHIPRIDRFGQGWYINTGDFIIERTYVVLENGKWRMERFEYDPKLGHNQIRKK